MEPQQQEQEDVEVEAEDVERFLLLFLGVKEHGAFGTSRFSFGKASWGLRKKRVL